jgi:yeast amino acid transporter
VTVTAFEAHEPRTSLRFSSKYIAYIITIFFLLCGLGEALNVGWDDPHLPQMTARRRSVDINNGDQPPESFSILVLAAELQDLPRSANVWNAFLIISCLSAANTALYVASRTLYGLCRDLPQDDPFFLKRWAAKLGMLDPRTRVPFWALIASTIAFFWLPFLHLREGYSVQSVRLLPQPICHCSTPILIPPSSAPQHHDHHR